MKTLFVIDLMPFLYRGHFVFLKKPRMTASGINTSALMGFANGVGAILSEFKPTHAALAMDPSGPTFRHEAYPPYKAQREKMPEDLAAAIPQAFELAEALNLPVIRKDGFEADDVMGTIAARAAAEGFEVFVATPDKDAAQLVGPSVKLYRPAHGKDSGEIFDVEKVKEHWNLSEPAQMIDYLALAGDSSDNIPGIRGVGEKTAAELIAAYGTVENILAHAGELKGKLAEKVAAGAEDAKMSKFLTTIRTDVPLELDLESLARRPHDDEKLRAVCAKYELTQLARKLLGDADGLQAAAKAYATIADTPHEYTLVKTPDEARALARALEDAPRFAFDTETTGIDPWHDDLVGMSFATEPGRAWYVAVPKHGAASAEDLFALVSAPADRAAAEEFVGIFAPAFADPSKTLIAQNAKFDMTILGRYGISFGSTVHDTLLAHYVTDAAARHGMDLLSREFLSYDPIPITRLIGEPKRGEPQKSMGDIPPEGILDYAAEDADVALRLEDVLRPRAVSAGALQALVESEEPLVPVLIDMERAGVKIDAAALAAYGARLQQEIDGIAAEIRAGGAADLNIDSPKQLGEYLFGENGILKGCSAAKKTSTGQFATDEKTLLKCADMHPIVRKVLDYRACTKLKSTYADKLPHCTDAEGRVHTTFAQAFTETGRLSSSEPNLQNIPVRSERGRPIRAAFIARDADHLLVSADYSQIELRIMAAMSGDETMLAAFRDGADIHRETAARVYDVMPALVTEEMRAKCKMVNFGIIYGISAFGLSQRLQIPRREAADLIDSYFRLYPKVRAFMDASIAKARDAGYAVTALGRRRTLRDINSRNATARQAAERDAINTPVQGTAADLIKLAMVRVHRALAAEGLRSKLVLQIHDELLFDCPKDEVPRVEALAKREMESALDLGVPLEVAVGHGVNWLEAH